MTSRVLLGAGCVLLSLLSVWIVDPGSRNAAFLVVGAGSGAAGVLVVALLTSALRRRRTDGSPQ